MYIGLHVKYRYSCQISMKLEFSRQIIEKYSNIKLHEILHRESRVVARLKTDRQTDMTKLIVAFRNFANAPTKANHNMYSLDVLQI